VRFDISVIKELIDSFIHSAAYQLEKIYTGMHKDNCKLAFELIKWYSGIQTVEHYAFYSSLGM